MLGPQGLLHLCCVRPPPPCPLLQVLIIGCGSSIVPLPLRLQQELADTGVAIELLDTVGHLTDLCCQGHIPYIILLRSMWLVKGSSISNMCCVGPCFCC